MLTLIFLILMFVFFGNMITLAIKLTWGFAKIFLGLIFLPIILIVIAFVGFIYLSVFFPDIWRNRNAYRKSYKKLST